MDSLDGGDGLATGLELSIIVLNHSSNSGDEVEGSGEWGDILSFGGSAGHEVVPVSHCDLGIPESSEDVSELDLLRIIASFAHDLVQYDSLIECLVDSSPLVRELRARVSGVEGKIHNWRKLAKISKEKPGVSSKHLLGVVREGLAKTSVHLAEGLPPYH